MRPTHATATNWEIFMTLPNQAAEADEELARALHSLDGTDDWSFALYRINSDKIEAALEFLQSAGTAGRLTVEMMCREPHGADAFALYSIGKPGGDTTTDVTIQFSGKNLALKANEVMSAASALPSLPPA